MRVHAMDDKDLYAGLIRLQIMHSVVEEGPGYGPDDRRARQALPTESGHTVPDSV